MHVARAGYEDEVVGADHINQASERMVTSGVGRRFVIDTGTLRSTQ